MASITQTQVTRFSRLFRGYERAYCQYVVTHREESGKLVGDAHMRQGATTPDVVKAHLEGRGGMLSVISLRQDNTCYFGCIDYDRMNANHAKAEEAVRKLGLPLMVCRSKSGSLHLFTFVKEPVDARVLRAKLETWAAQLGMSGQKTELFPKQTSRSNETDIGQGINLPYYGGNDTTSYAVGNGQILNLNDFLDMAESFVSPLDLLQQTSIGESELFEDGPPCLQILEKQGGLPEGGRNIGMLSVTSYLKKRYGDQWEQHVDTYAEAMAGDLPSSEIQGIVKNARKREYQYSCTQEPIKSFCQRGLCRTRLYGIGNDSPADTANRITSITRYDAGGRREDPIWAVEVDGVRVSVNTSQLYSRDEFNRAAMAQANIVAITMSPAKWLEFLRKRMPDVVAIATPDDASQTGQLHEWLDRFLRDQPRVREGDPAGVNMGQLLPDPVEQRIYFRSASLLRYLEAQRFRIKNEAWLWEKLNERGGESKQKKIKGEVVRLWSLPMPTLESDEPASNGAQPHRNGTSPLQEVPNEEF